MLQSRTQLVVFLLAVIAENSAKSIDYKEESKEAVLSPSPVTDPITSVTWKHYGDIALDWFGDQIVCYRQFRDRCKLNKTTGELTIMNLYKTDSGIYTPEINNIILQTTEILVISPVPTPTVTTRCNGEKTHCLLTCEGNITGAEPVSYVWMSGHTSLPSSTKELNITKEERKDSISCMLRNPVSNRSSEIPNPFKEINNRAHYGMLCIVPFLVLVLVICVIIFIKKVKSREEKSLLPSQDSLPITSFSRDEEKGVENGNEERGGQDVPPEEPAISKPSEKSDDPDNTDDELNEKHTSVSESFIRDSENKDKDSGKQNPAAFVSALPDLQDTTPNPESQTNKRKRSEEKPKCKYDPNCYRKNRKHWRDFRHTTERRLE